MAAQPPVTILCNSVTGSTSSTTYTFTVTAASNAGDALLTEILCNQNGSNVTSVVDSKGNTYTLIGSFTTNTPNRYAWYCPGATGGPGGGPTAALAAGDTITVTAAAKVMTVNL